jgi:branched-chain amino acid transport system substrate-binding protein
MKHAFNKTLMALAALSAIGVTSAQAQVKIGFLATLSGPSADVGTDQYDGFMLAVERLGGKLGGQSVTVIKEDDQQKPDVALNGVTKLLEKDKVDIVTGLTFANILMALQPKIAATQVPFIGSVAGPSPTAGALCKPNLFVTSWQSDAPAEAMGKFIGQRGIKQLATMTPNFQGGKDKIVGLKRNYKTPLIEEMYTPLNQLDFSAEITQLNASKPDGVFAFYPGGLGVTFVRQYQQAGLSAKVPLFTTNTIEGANVEAMGNAINGAFVADTWTPGMPGAESKAFVADFEKKFNRSPSAYAAFSYDAAILIDAALKATKGNAADKKELARAISAVSFKSLRGPFRFGKNNYPVQNYHVFQVTKSAKGAEYKLVGENVLEAHVDAYAGQCAAK